MKRTALAATITLVIYMTLKMKKQLKDLAQEEKDFIYTSKW
jgi:hypothetical protein